MVLVIQIILTVLISKVASRHIDRSDIFDSKWIDYGLLDFLTDLDGTKSHLNPWLSEDVRLRLKTADTEYKTTTSFHETLTTTTQRGTPGILLSKSSETSLNGQEKDNSITFTPKPLEPKAVFDVTTQSMETTEKDSKETKIKEVKAKAATFKALNERKVTDVEYKKNVDHYIKLLHSVITAPLVLSVDWLLNVHNNTIKAKVKVVNIDDLNEIIPFFDFNTMTSLDTEIDANFELPEKVNSIPMSGANQPAQVFVNRYPERQTNRHYFYVKSAEPKSGKTPTVQEIIEGHNIGDDVWLNSQPMFGFGMLGDSMFG